MYCSSAALAVDQISRLSIISRELIISPLPMRKLFSHIYIHWRGICFGIGVDSIPVLVVSVYDFFLMGGMGPVSLIFTPVFLTIKHISCNDFNELLSLPYNFLFFSVSPCGKLTYNYASKLFSASPLTKREILNAVYRGQIQWLTFAPQLLDPRLFSPFILYDKKLPSPNRHLPPVRWSSHSSEEPAA